MKAVTLLALFTFALTCHAGEMNKPAPAFELPHLDAAQTITSLDSTNGKIRYLDFWASWCAPCRVSVPAIIQLQADLGGDDFEVIAVNVDENPDAARRFLKRYDINYTVLSDPDASSAADYKLPGMPTSYVLDRDGVIKLVHSGFKPGDMDKIRETITALLEQE